MYPLVRFNVVSLTEAPFEGMVPFVLKLDRKSSPPVYGSA